MNRLVGFCLLIKREVIDAIGLLDERFGIGCFEDDDYCLRAIQAGYRAVIAGDAFIHHFGGRTFVGSGADSGAILRENGERFRVKWAGAGRSETETCGQREGRVRRPAPRVAAPTGHRSTSPANGHASVPQECHSRRLPFSERTPCRRVV